MTLLRSHTRPLTRSSPNPTNRLQRTPGQSRARTRPTAPTSDLDVRDARVAELELGFVPLSVEDGRDALGPVRLQLGDPCAKRLLICNDSPPRNKRSDRFFSETENGSLNDEKKEGGGGERVETHRRARR